MARLASAHPRVEKITALPDFRLDVLFVDGDHRIYDCSPLLSREPFSLLRAKGLFAALKIMPGGYGIAWTEAIDLDAYELWAGGVPVMATARADHRRKAAQPSMVAEKKPTYGKR